MLVPRGDRVQAFEVRESGGSTSLRMDMRLPSRRNRAASISQSCDGDYAEKQFLRGRQAEGRAETLQNMAGWCDRSDGVAARGERVLSRPVGPRSFVRVAHRDLDPGPAFSISARQAAAQQHNSADPAPSRTKIWRIAAAAVRRARHPLRAIVIDGRDV
jgi:hypothetical protein